MIDLDKPVALQERTVVRKGLDKLRSEGLVPAVIHNHGQQSVYVMASQLELENLYKAAGKHHPLNLEVGSDKFLVLIKDAHFNPVKRRLQHVVFQAIKRDEKVEAEVPVHLEGDIPAEKAGLQIIRQLDSVEVEALPQDLPDELKVDAAKLTEIGDKVLVSDLVVPAKVTVLTDAEQPIATVIEPIEQKIVEPEPEIAEGEEAVEGEEAAEGAEGEAPAAGETTETPPAEGGQKPQQ